MKSLRTAIYLSIAIHFLRSTARKLSPGHAGIPRRTPRGCPTYVEVLGPGPGEHRPIALCDSARTASALASALESMSTLQDCGFVLNDASVPPGVAAQLSRRPVFVMDGNLSGHTHSLELSLLLSRAVSGMPD